MADRATWRRIAARSLTLGLLVAALSAMGGGAVAALISSSSALLVIVPLTLAQRWLADHTLLASLSSKLSVIACVLVTLAFAQGTYAYLVWGRGATPPEAWRELGEAVGATPWGILLLSLVYACSFSSGLGMAAAINQAQPRGEDFVGSLIPQFAGVAGTATLLVFVVRLFGPRSVSLGDVIAFLFAVSLVQVLSTLAGLLALRSADWVERVVFRER